MFRWKGEGSLLGNDRGSAHIYVLATMFLFVLLALFTTIAFAFRIQMMATIFHDRINTAAQTALGDHTVPDPTNGGVHVVDVSDMKQEFMNNVQNLLQSWPQSSYTLQSFQVFGESDRKNTPPPAGFSQPVPGTSVYITMNFNFVVNTNLIPMPVTRWSVPVYCMVSSNSFESSTKAWNLARQN
jgi:hypothetical protein